MKFKGKVIRGNQRGKDLGFPTANINLSDPDLIGAEGIYISKVNIEKIWYPALTFVGPAKTFDEKKIQAETYILDFDKDIYDQWITVELLEKIRDNEKFNSAEDLIIEMKKDEQKARIYFQNLPLD